MDEHRQLSPTPPSQSLRQDTSTPGSQQNQPERDSSPPYSPRSFHSNSARPSPPPASSNQKRKRSPLEDPPPNPPLDSIPASTTSEVTVSATSSQPAADFISLDFLDTEDGLSRDNRPRKRGKKETNVSYQVSISDEEGGGVEEKTSAKTRRKRRRERKKPGAGKPDNTNTTATELKTNGQDMGKSEDPIQLSMSNRSSPDGSEDDKDAMVRRIHESRKVEKSDDVATPSSKSSNSLGTITRTDSDKDAKRANGVNGGSSKDASSDRENSPTGKRLSKKERKKKRRQQLRLVRKLAKKEAMNKAKASNGNPDERDSEPVQETREVQVTEDNTFDLKINLQREDDNGLIDYDEMMEQDRLVLKEDDETKQIRLEQEERQRKRYEMTYAEIAKEGKAYVSKDVYDDMQPKVPKAVPGKEDVFLDVDEAILQRKYYDGYELPPMPYEEDRPFFSRKREPISSERVAVDFLEPISEAQRVCKSCTETGHSELRCPQLWCLECGAWNEHFTRNCPNKVEVERTPQNIGFDISPAEDLYKDLPPIEIINDLRVTWRVVPDHRCEPGPLEPITRLNCYSCGAVDHFGGECPFVYGYTFGDNTPFSWHGMRKYSNEPFMDEYAKKLDELQDKYKIKFGKGASTVGFVPGYLPFEVYRRQQHEERGAARKAHDARLPSKPKAVNDWFPDRKDSSGRGRGGGGYRGSSGRGRGGYDSRRRSPPPRMEYPRERYDRDYVGKVGGGYRDRDTYRPMPSSSKENWNRFLR